MSAPRESGQPMDSQWNANGTPPDCHEVPIAGRDSEMTGVEHG